MSFLALGIFWVCQQSQFGQLKAADRDLTWVHIGFLFLVTILPLSTRLLADFDTLRLPIVIYWLNILAMGAALWAGWSRAQRAGLIREDAPAGHLPTQDYHRPDPLRGGRGPMRHPSARQH